MYKALGKVVVKVSRGGGVCLLEVCWVLWSADVLVPGHQGVRLVGSMLYDGVEGVGVGGWVSMLYRRRDRAATADTCVL